MRFVSLIGHPLLWEYDDWFLGNDKVSVMFHHSHLAQKEEASIDVTTILKLQNFTNLRVQHGTDSDSQ